MKVISSGLDKCFISFTKNKILKYLRSVCKYLYKRLYTVNITENTVFSFLLLDVCK